MSHLAMLHLLLSSTTWDSRSLIELELERDKYFVSNQILMHTDLKILKIKYFNSFENIVYLFINQLRILIKLYAL